MDESPVTFKAGQSRDGLFRYVKLCVGSFVGPFMCLKGDQKKIKWVEPTPRWGVVTRLAQAHDF